jgi:TetR/AcrR family transcriptional regulator, transcriptional repressor for nem operon
MVRTRTFDPATALSKAVELFSSKGYSETSMEDIVQATGVSRYGLYGTFGNKRELFEQALERYADSMGKQAFLRLLEPGASLEHIRRIFEDRVTDMCAIEDNSGCLFIHSTMDLAPDDNELREVLRKFMGRIAKLFAVGLESAKERGEVRQDLDVAASGEVLTSMMFGLVVLGRTGFPRETLDGIVDTTLASFTD